jgi:chromosome segregation ATPase
MSKTRDSSPVMSRAGTPITAPPVTGAARRIDINEARIEVNQAETRLKQARDLLAQAEHDQTKRKLAEIRTTLAQQEQQLQQMTVDIGNARGAAKRLQADVDRITNAISQLTLKRPSVADALPDDPQVKAWQRQYDHLQNLRDKAIARRNEAQALVTADPLEAVRLDNSIRQLRYAEANLLRKLEGTPVGWVGGMSRVL